MVIISFLLAGIWRVWFWCRVIRVSPFLVWYIHLRNYIPCFLFQKPSTWYSFKTEHCRHTPECHGAWQKQCFLCKLCTIHHIIKLKHFHVGRIYAITAIPGWVSLYVPGSAGSSISNQYKGGWACLRSGRLYSYRFIHELVIISWIIFEFWFRFLTTSHMLRKMLLMKKGNRYACSKNLCCTT